MAPTDELRRKAAYAAETLERSRRPSGGPGYSWPERSCLSIAESACLALGCNAFADREAVRTVSALSEGRAFVTALRRSGSFSEWFREELEPLGWSDEPVDDDGEPCDLVFFGPCSTRRGAYCPTRPETMQLLTLQCTDGMMRAWDEIDLVHLAYYRLPVLRLRYGG